jgi:hypothetical protein
MSFANSLGCKRLIAGGVMKKAVSRNFAILSLLIVVACYGYATPGPTARTHDWDNDDNRFENARVVEVTDSRISIIASDGIEHVIAVDADHTDVKRDGKIVSLKDLRVGDIVSVQLDEKNAVMFAKNIELNGNSRFVARNRR